MKDDHKFQISFMCDGGNQLSALTISHADETYAFELNGKAVSIINNGDNSWSLVVGELDQLNINLIGDAIERFYKEQGW